MEAEIRTYSSEIERLKELSKKVIEGASVAPAFVSVCVVCVCVCVCVCVGGGGGVVCVCVWLVTLHASHPPTTMQDRLGVKGQMEEDIVEEEVEVQTFCICLSLVPRPPSFAAFMVAYVAVPDRLSRISSA